LAEFVRLFSTDRELAQRLAPQTTQSFRKVIAQDPILTDFYNQAVKGTKEVKPEVKPEIKEPPKESELLEQFKDKIRKSEPIIKEVKLAEDLPKRKMTLKYVGRVGDYITFPKLRETIKDVLDTPIYVYDGSPTLHGYPEASYKGIFSPQAFFDENYNLVNAILINKKEATTFKDLKTIYHEAIHAQRYKMDKGFDFSTAYDKRTFEQSAKRAEDFYNQAVKGTKEVKEVKKPTLPKRQPPKNIPPKKPAVVKSKTANQELIGKSKLAQGVEAKAIAKKLTEGFADLPEYEKINIKDQATKARKLLEDDYPRAERIALGKELPPEGILPESVFIAVENRAIKNKDVNTLRRLATESGLSNEATLMGQRIRTLAERVEDSPTAAMAKVIKNRKEYYALKHKTPLDEAIKQETDKIKEDIKKSAPKKDDWLDFVNSITC
jgi:hypothetical protein